MEQSKQNLIKILLIVNLVISACTAIGVGYVAYKQSASPNFSEMGPRGDGQMFPGNGEFQPGQFQPGQDQPGQTK
ncbi:hypothetical protein [Bacillus sp. FJAT-50079]|uniref:hypothetical protein n=1 Tax=Bacillus sp. FJAT-50079 TaxID=2833577 RepID=UPI001BC9DF40|nr:hypothetical protein [Bacillus sp. FJAT-50079]MBS4209528.1 hypothetical protein [Bacillus sp. FJAT-50079]